ncbi:MAG: protein kinase [Pirellulaceae bacterium]|jgi:serine/threonine protein kinase/WD40 repeat protein|nr:protein kinase [Pirellulaceae bacterium]
MSPNQIDKEQIFNSAADLADVSQRAAYLDQACGNDAQLRTEIEELLRHDDDAGSFLDQPAVNFSPTIAIGEFDSVDESSGEVSLAFLEPSDKPGCVGTMEHYEVIELVGRGGMGLVLRAFDPKLNRVVAIKVMAPELAANPMAVKRFLREARAAAAVSHDHVVTIHAIHDAHRPPFIVMEFVDGQSLQEKIDRTGGLELKETLRIGMQTARGLSAAHEQGLVHRDIKPSNILLENGIERVKLTDFGLARAVDDVSVTQTGQIAGTPQFMSPEQAQGQTVDARSDLFSLGSVLYAVCTSRPPFRADTALAMLRRVTDDEPRSICEVNSDIPNWLEAIIFKLLAKDPADRIQSAKEVADLLGQHLAYLQHPTTAPKPQPTVPPKLIGSLHQPKPLAERAKYMREPITRRLWPVVAIGVAAMLIGIAVFGMVIYVVTDNGTLVIESTDNNAVVTISKPVSDTHKGFEIHVVDKITGSGVVSLRSGHYRLLAFDTDPNAGHELKIRLSKEQFVLRRGGKVVVKVTRVPIVQPAQVAVPSTTGITEVRLFDGHTNTIERAVFFNDGHRVASASLDTTIRIWDVASGNELQRIDIGKPLSGMAISPDDKWVAVGIDDKQNASIEIWDVASGNKIADLEWRMDRVVRLEFSPDRRHLLSSGEDRVARLWNLSSWTVSREFEISNADTTCLSPDGRLIAGRDRKDDDFIWLWSSETYEPEARLDTTTAGKVQRCQFTSDSKMLVTGSFVGVIQFWDVDSGTEVRKLKAHRGPIFDIQLTGDGRHLISTGMDRGLRLWDVRTGSLVAEIDTKPRFFKSLDISPDGHHVIAAGAWSRNATAGRYEIDGDFDAYLYRLPKSVWQKAADVRRDLQPKGRPRSQIATKELDQLVELAENALSRVEKLVKNGVVSSADLMKASAELIEAKVRRAEARNEMGQVLALLGRLIELRETELKMVQALNQSGAATASDVRVASKALLEAKVRLVDAQADE